MKINMTLYFDVDNVLLNFNNAFIEYWNSGVDSGRWDSMIKIPQKFNNWNYDFVPGSKDHEVYSSAMDAFHKEVRSFPLMEETIPQVMSQLHQYYKIVLVSAYPKEYYDDRVENLTRLQVPYNELHCGIEDKLGFITSRDGSMVRQSGDYPGKSRSDVVALFEDSPYTLSAYIERYPRLTWCPLLHAGYSRHLEGDSRIKVYDSAVEWLYLII